MKLCESCLQTWTPNTFSPQSLVDKYTMAGLELGHYYAAAPDFSNVVVAEVLECKRHPEADKLSICQVDNGQEIVQIVCGAANVRQGLKVALAKPGAELPNGIKIAQAKLRGELSMGMLCSAVELGCAETSDGIWELPKEAITGTDFREYFNLNERVYEFELTPNRGDCFSAKGLARELAAIAHLEFKPAMITPVPAQHNEQIPVQIEDASLCPRYCGRYIKGIKPHVQSPVWLREKMRRLGLRSIHPVVDVLNYVMFYLGQPLHAFDLHKIKRQIIVRRARSGESIALLNGKTLNLNQGTPVIADTEGPIAIAGVMGSLPSSVDEDSLDIFIESAFFTPLALAGIARQYGLSTDASMRYERGVDPNLAVEALEFATDLLIQIVGGTPGPLQIHEHQDFLAKEQHITYHPEHFSKRTGVVLSNDEMWQILERLDFKLKQDGEVWQVTVPSFRFDIQEEVDLIEEILRIYGYDKIPCLALAGDLQSADFDKHEAWQQQAGSILSDLGYYEVINYAFVDPKLQELLYPQQKAIEVLNPISPELSQMRLGLWPGLLANLVHNTNRQQQSLRIFETGVRFQGTSQNPEESPCLAGLLYGEKAALNWCSPESYYDFYDCKGHVEHLLQQMGYSDYSFTQHELEALHPGQAAALVVAGQVCGVLGAIHPRWQQALDLAHPIFVWEIYLDKLPARIRPRYTAVSKFPQTRRDISFLVAQEIPVAEILKTISKTISRDILKDVEVFDVYQGKGVPEGLLSLAVALIFQDAEKTLVESDIVAYQEAILKVLKQDYDIQLRDGNECLK